ncbi:MAG: hypothetical protein IKM81_02840 [Fibrobacter sp.]|nr:hypothetical protein [Fibrobacter sp.]
MTYNIDWATILVIVFVCTSQAFAWTREKYERALAVFCATALDITFLLLIAMFKLL